jgi:hypothetical protein
MPRPTRTTASKQVDYSYKVGNDVDTSMVQKKRASKENRKPASRKRKAMDAALNESLEMSTVNFETSKKSKKNGSSRNVLSSSSSSDKSDNKSIQTTDKQATSSKRRATIPVLPFTKSNALQGATKFLKSFMDADSERDTLIVEKDRAFAALLTKYKALKQQQSSEFKVIKSNFEATVQQQDRGAQKVIEFWKNENKQMDVLMSETGMKEHSERYETLVLDHQQLLQREADLLTKVTGLEEQLLQAEATNEKQLGEFEEIHEINRDSIRCKQQIVDYYQMLSGIQITPGETLAHPVRCTMNNPADNRMMEYTLDVDVDEDTNEAMVNYYPIKIIANNESYPKFLAEEITYTSQFAPLFTKHVLGAIYNNSKKK